MKRIFINQEADANKFWTIALIANSFTVTFGKMGTAGRISEKTFIDEETCVSEAEKLIKEKIRKGYFEQNEMPGLLVAHAAVYQPINEAIFWNIIALLNWKKLGNDDAVVRPVIKKLASLPVEDIQQFAEILAEKLYLLDTIAFAENLGGDAYRGDDQPFSVDYFLYARCVVVANGQEYFEYIFENPSEMPKEMDFEPLIYIADTAYNKKMKTEDKTLETKYSFETFSNKEGWNRGA